MLHDQLIDKTLERLGANLSPVEKASISFCIEAGRTFGYGNMIAWLSTAWAVELRDTWGFDEEMAGKAALGHNYPLPPPSTPHPTGG